MTQVGAAAPEATGAPLVETKLIPPRARPQLVGRPRLLQALDRLDGTELTLVSAPAGGGKSVLVGSWCETRPETAVAWVSLDPADNDPARLWTYVATAVDRIRPGVGGRALSRLQSPGATVGAGLDELLNGMAAHREPIAVVLDDLHSLSDEPALQSLEYAVERLPPGTRMIATTRTDPRIRLGRLRARGELAELRARDLAFTLDEARELLVVREGIALDDDDLSHLLERSEGWPAGLYLAALWLRDHSDPRAGVRDFTGDHRHVADYLLGEVIEALDEATRDFLLRTSVLPRLSGALCDAVLDRNGSSALLAKLARSNLFLVPLDARDEWYRYHHLFGELLRMELARAWPGDVDELHRRAGDWCRRHGLLEEALEHAAAAGDEAVVADMLLEHHAALLRSGRETTLLRWVERLGAGTLMDVPVLPVAGAIAAGLLSRPASARARLLLLADESVAERPERSSPYLESAASLARGVWIDGDIGRAVRNARRAAGFGRNGADEIATAALAALAFALYVQGELPEARTVAQEALDRPDSPERPHGLAYALSTLALLELERERAHAAEAYAGRALDVTAAAGLSGSWSAGLAHTALGAALVSLKRFAEAERHAARGEALRRAPEPTVEEAHALVVLANARLARRRLSAAAADLERAREALGGFADPGSLPALVARVERDLEAARDSAPRLVEEPSRSELAVLRLLATDLTQRQIGEQLYLSLNTVKTHTRGIYRKLGASSRQEAVAAAETLGLLDDGDD
jgi:LuxR family transcriptional regulator, maltose regulon positive regulatory protein